MCCAGRPAPISSSATERRLAFTIPNTTSMTRPFPTASPNGSNWRGGPCRPEALARSCTRYCGVEVYGAIPFPGADRGFSGLCGAIHPPRSARRAGLPHRCLRVQPIAPLRCTPQSAFAPSTWFARAGLHRPKQRGGGRLEQRRVPTPASSSIDGFGKVEAVVLQKRGRARHQGAVEARFRAADAPKAFQSFPFPSISGVESRLINGLRARGQQELFSFPPSSGRRPASFQKFRRRASVLPS